MLVPSRARAALALGLSAAAVLVTACQAEVRPGVVERVGGPQTGSVSVSVSVSGPGPASPAPGLSQPGTGITRGDGIYTPGRNVDIYQLVSLDVAEMATLTNAVNEGRPLPVDEIQTIYEQAKHARIGETTRALKAFATNPNRATEFPEEAAFFGSPTFLDAPVADALAGTGTAAGYTPAQRRQAIQKGLLRILRYYSIQELLAAEPKIRAGNLTQPSGAPGNVDEAWALYVGAERDGQYPYALAATAQAREENFRRPGSLDRPLREAFARAQRAASAGDLAAWEAAKAEVFSRMNAIFYLSAARYFNEALRAAQAGNVAGATTSQVEGLSYYLTIQPRVAAADPAADRTILEFYRADPSTLTVARRDQALSALNRAADSLGLRPEDLLSPSDFS